MALDGAFIVAQAVAPHMIRRGGGALVGLSGISTHIGMPNRAHVSASKMTHLLVGPDGGYVTSQTIHVNGGAFLTCGARADGRKTAW